MPYTVEICAAGKTIEICKYHSSRIHPRGEKRGAREHPTSEAQKRVNQRKAEKKLRRLMNHNFQDGDLLVRLDFFKELRPKGSKEMQECISDAVKKIRAKAKRAGVDIKYIYVKEVGPRGGRHIHIMLTKIDTDILRECWPYGGVHIDPLNSGGQYRKIAAYFIKYAARTEETEGVLIGKRWYGSRNLAKPKVKKRIVSANHFRKRVKVPEGYSLEKDSVVSGISDFTGYEYFSCTMIRDRKKGGG
jgi:hypothetical protein